ncbi:thioredoxin family protein [Opitutus sp. ER46]|uniref:thioredoxin family protein n=1 Tax=Opitutus sp. ER46 TaxID=2161864 RepID=UPI000D320D8B|nr:thioredoxin family protein [Opitutus sp. ER46]PTY00650.1 thioredoxin [Opitutus sp. ER46]
MKPLSLFRWLLLGAVLAVGLRAAEQPAPVALPRLVDLGSGKCVPCRMMTPILEELRRDHASSFEVIFIDIGQDRTAAKTHGIRVIPTQIFYDAAGKERFRHEGFMPKADILAKFRELGVALKPEAGAKAK